MKKTSYEISKKLAEIGFRAETDFCWSQWKNANGSWKNVGGSPNVTLSYIGDDCDMDAKPMQPVLDERATLCYNLETILEALPKFINCNDYEYCLTFWLARHLYYELVGDKENIDVFKFEIKKDENESLADTAARLLILLYEKNLVNFN
jgi:hypothetical protein